MNSEATVSISMEPIKPPEPWDVALERCMHDIEREVGPLSLYQSIAVRRALDVLAGDIRTISAYCDPWG